MNPSEAPPGCIAVHAQSFLYEDSCVNCIKHPTGSAIEMQMCHKDNKCVESHRKDKCNVYFIKAPKGYNPKQEPGINKEKE